MIGGGRMQGVEKSGEPRRIKDELLRPGTPGTSPTASKRVGVNHLSELGFLAHEMRLLIVLTC